MVVDESTVADQLLAEGRDVVLILASGAPPVDRERTGGRLSVIVGDPADPAVRIAAAEMDGELFGTTSPL